MSDNFQESDIQKFLGFCKLLLDYECNMMASLRNLLAFCSRPALELLYRHRHVLKLVLLIKAKTRNQASCFILLIK